MDQPIVSDVRAFLKKKFVAVLATSYRNLPYASIIYYTIDDNLNFYFVTKTNSDKYLNLKANRNVALAIGDGPKHISVQVRGHATILRDKRWRKRILDRIESILKEHKIKIWPIKDMQDMQTQKKELNQEIVYKIIPQHLLFTNLDDDSLSNSVRKTRHRIFPLLKK